MPGKPGGQEEGGVEAPAPLELRVEYKRKNPFFADYVKSLSRGRTSIATERPLPIGTPLRFSVVVPTLEAPIVLNAEVSAVDRSVSPPRMELRFVHADEEERRAFDRTVERLMVESLGRRLYGRLMDVKG
jgi:type IV pilus assembly protein PilZ